jgi:hypothetical protein
MGGGDESASPPAPTPPAPSEPDAVPELVVGAEPVIIHVPALPRYELTIARAGEYQIEALGAPMNAVLRLFTGESVVMQAGGGETADPRIVTFLEPGRYEIQVGEWRSRALDAQLTVTRIEPMTPVATLSPGDPPVIVTCPSGASPREASVEVALTIATSATYRIEARSADGSRDAELALLLDGGLIQADSDSGEETDARIVRELAPGSYTLRLRDWRNREAALAVTVAIEPPS